MVEAMCVKAGSSVDESRIVAKQIVESNLCGHDSHGVGVLPGYFRSIKSGKLSINQRVKTISDFGAVVILDGQNGFGQVVGCDAMQIGVGRARKFGVSVVALRNSHHLGRIATWGKMCADANCISIHFVNAKGGTAIVAPYGGIDARYSTNPYCTAFPATANPSVILDMATTKIAFGKARVALAEGTQTVTDAMIDSEGNPSINPEVLFRDPPGALLPMGDHKGYGLGLVCEFLAGVLTGGGTFLPKQKEHRAASNNMLTIIIDPSFFVTTDEFKQEFDLMAKYIKSSTPAKNMEVLLPGEPEQRVYQERSKNGVPIDSVTWRELLKTAEELGIPQCEIERIVG